MTRDDICLMIYMQTTAAGGSDEWRRVRATVAQELGLHHFFVSDRCMRMKTDPVSGRAAEGGAHVPSVRIYNQWRRDHEAEQQGTGDSVGRTAPLAT